jgi:hypothetical protein
MAQKKDFLLRIDPVIWQELQAWAADELRSVNGQIEFILRRAIKARRPQRYNAIRDKEEQNDSKLV